MAVYESGSSTVWPMSAGLNESAVFNNGTGYESVKNLHLFLKHGTLMMYFCVHTGSMVCAAEFRFTLLMSATYHVVFLLRIMFICVHRGSSRTV